MYSLLILYHSDLWNMDLRVIVVAIGKRSELGGDVGCGVWCVCVYVGVGWGWGWAENPCRHKAQGSSAFGVSSLWCHLMETFSALLAIFVGNSAVWSWWFKTPWRPLWRHYNVLLPDDQQGELRKNEQLLIRTCHSAKADLGEWSPKLQCWTSTIPLGIEVKDRLK